MFTLDNEEGYRSPPRLKPRFDIRGAAFRMLADYPIHYPCFLDVLPSPLLSPYAGPQSWSPLSSAPSPSLLLLRFWPSNPCPCIQAVIILCSCPWSLLSWSPTPAHPFPSTAPASDELRHGWVLLHFAANYSLQAYYANSFRFHLHRGINCSIMREVVDLLFPKCIRFENILRPIRLQFDLVIIFVFSFKWFSN